MRNVLVVMGYDVPALKDCEYRFYRGSEWLTIYCEKLDMLVELYHYSNVYFSVEEFENSSLNDFSKRTYTRRRCFFRKEYTEILKCVENVALLDNGNTLNSNDSL